MLFWNYRCIYSQDGAEMAPLEAYFDTPRNLVPPRTLRFRAHISLQRPLRSLVLSSGTPAGLRGITQTRYPRLYDDYMIDFYHECTLDFEHQAQRTYRIGETTLTPEVGLNLPEEAVLIFFSVYTYDDTSPISPIAAFHELIRRHNLAVGAFDDRMGRISTQAIWEGSVRQYRAEYAALLLCDLGFLRPTPRFAASFLPYSFISPFGRVNIHRIGDCSIRDEAEYDRLQLRGHITRFHCPCRCRSSLRRH